MLNVGEGLPPDLAPPRTRTMGSSALFSAVVDIDLDESLGVAVVVVERSDCGLGVRRHEAQTKDEKAFILADLIEGRCVAVVAVSSHFYLQHCQLTAESPESALRKNYGQRLTVSPRRRLRHRVMFVVRVVRARNDSGVGGRERRPMRCDDFSWRRSSKCLVLDYGDPSSSIALHSPLTPCAGSHLFPSGRDSHLASL